MPTFDFTCRTCKKDYEILILNREEKPTCPICGAELVKLFSPVVPNFRLRGKDWSGSKIIPVILKDKND